MEKLGDKTGASLVPTLKFTEVDGEWVKTLKTERPEVEVYLEEMKHFVGCIRQNMSLGPLPEHGALVMRIMDAIHKSADTWREERVVIGEVPDQK